MSPNTSGRNNAKIRRMLRRVILLLISILIFAAAVVSLWPEPVRVETEEVTRGLFEVSVVEEGKTKIRHRYIVSSPAGGFLDRVALRPGDAVSAGSTVLAVMKGEPAGLLSSRAVAEGEARLKAAEAAISLRRAELDRAGEDHELARIQFERLDRLLPSGGIARQDWDIARNRMQSMSKVVKSARFSLKMAEFEAEQARSALLQGSSESSSKEIRILSPVDGFVLNVFEESSRTLPAGTPILEVGDPEDLEGEVDLFSVDAAVVMPGSEVRITGWGGDVPLAGRVSLVERSGFTKISALGVEEQRVRARIDFLDPVPGGYRLGDRYRIEVRIILRKSEKALLVPMSALFRRGGDWTVFAAQEGKAVSRRIRIGQNDGIRAEVLDGLSEGEQVILHPSAEISDGVQVAVK